MRYPVISSSDANTYLVSRRAGSSVDAARFVKSRGQGEELTQDFIHQLRKELIAIREHRCREHLHTSEAHNLLLTLHPSGVTNPTVRLGSVPSEDLQRCD